ncbi:MAG: hypothetical protein ABI199_02895 [Bacteroidia bacterium]
MITIKKVINPKGLKQFIDFPHHLYKDDPNYVPELFMAQKELLDPKKHPFFKHSKLDLFLAFKGTKIVGRIAAIRNNNHIKYTEEKEGFFGFFDVVNDFEVAEKLLDSASDWVKEEGLLSIVGPVNHSTNETCGVLIEGTDSAPFVMMTYNKAYYPAFLEKYGFKKKMDLIAYHLLTKDLSDKTVRLLTTLENRLQLKDIMIRTVNMKKFDEEIEKIKLIYNTAWDKNWGFVPMTDDEFRFMAKDMKMIIDPDFCYIAEYKGKGIGFSLCIPDLNQILKTIKNGRLFPTGIFKLLLNKRKVNAVRVLTLGVIEGYRKLGIEACFYGRNIITAKKKNIIAAEASWILENNFLMNQAMLNIKGTPYKKYRIYEAELK